MGRLTFVVLAAAAVASAHTIMNQLGTEIEEYPQGAAIYMPSSNYPQINVSSNSISCNGPPVTGFTSSSQVISVEAGTNVTGAWLHTLTSTGPDSSADNKVIASSHKGPVMAYMKKVENAADSPANAPGDGWFKVAEMGLVNSTAWAVDVLIADGGIQTVPIPSCLEDGDYLLRFEIIALHNAYAEGGAQFYLECGQFSVSGGTSIKAPETYSIPGIYSATSPSIMINIYNAEGLPYPSNYTIPGPPVFTC